MNTVETYLDAFTPQHTTVLNSGPAPSLIRSIFNALTSFAAVIGALLIAAVFWKCRPGIADPDIWWHLRNAQHLVQTFRFPSIDMYSFSTAGSPWLNHEWLSELVYYAVFNAFGLRGMYILFASLLALLMVAVFSLALKESTDPLAAGIATTVGAVLAVVGFGPRTQSFGWLCFVGVFAILLRFRSGRADKLWIVPVLFCLWINCHGSWLIGLVVYSIFIIAGLITRDRGRLIACPWTSSQLKKLLAVGAVSLLALLINPFGYRLLVYPFDMISRQQLNVATVQEWASVNFNDGRGKVVAFVLAAIFVMALIGRKRWRVDDALLTAFALYAGLTHIRFLLLTGIVLPPILAPQMIRFGSAGRRRERRFVNMLLLGVVIAVSVRAIPPEQLLQTEVRAYFPVGAVQFLRTHPQNGHIFNEYEWGGYLEWTLPHVQTFIDSRTDIFEYKGVLKDYLDVIQIEHSQERLDRYQTQYILYSTDTPFDYFLSRSAQWESIYRDKNAVLYRKVGCGSP